jgi:hypothetical protein
MAERNMREELGFASGPDDDEGWGDDRQLGHDQDWGDDQDWDDDGQQGDGGDWDDDGFWGDGEFWGEQELSGASADDGEDEDEGFADEDYGEDPRPEWLHPDCRDVRSALERGTCCKYPASPLVAIAGALADAVTRAESGLGGTHCPQAGAELGRCFQGVLGLLAQIHATVTQLTPTALAQLLCPVGALAGALDRACGDGCPWGCEHRAFAGPAAFAGFPDRRAEFGPLGELVGECAATVRATLDWFLGQRPGPMVVPPHRTAGTGE